MESPKDLNVRQLLAYAKDNGYDNVKFIGKSENGFFVGEFLDAYFEFIKIPVIGDGFVTISQIEEVFGYDIKFDIVKDEEYQWLVNMDFILHGKKPSYMGENDGDKDKY